ncbi:MULTISPECIES: LysM peptidoglycan-binding domain-containing protein [Anoxybacillus]|uniref:Peptidoglycan-binding LysM n=1 Tax=Anoxybacillus flavithermus TaxID=33934 RepID=A0A178T696_9BACL|nr:SafA/ExsA family spore coat assembly protein [Anoxybacillus flavithermus]ASA97834.1 peptidoglycan-binding protein [Anoxybacillus flavithermus]ELK22657.1 spore coat assembly protein SafA [Anoxybacillus flavithermus TNO-09.006]MBE2904294.1 SafA/ExsA family spore coat assembly protein [Anoxybacillus flavithermus]MBE2907003.1 SafA/ExsA family spore coat assembly protein [Anoxybacillus flavithermus]MBE2909622.1 SafA/ExsA family spore coat assembly protein [Anoxybacillus flavithermus]
MKIHIVQKGDTLWKIAEKYGVDFEELKKMNAHLSDPDYIMPGMKIKVPTPVTPVKPAKKETQNVQQQRVSVDVDIHVNKKEQPLQQPINVEPIAKEVPIVKEPVKKEEPKQEMPLLPPKPPNIMPNMMEHDDDVQMPPFPDIPPIPPTQAPMMEEKPQEEQPQQPMQPQPVPMPLPMPCIPISPMMPGYGFYPWFPPMYPMMPWIYPQNMANNDDCGCGEPKPTPYMPQMPTDEYSQQLQPMMPQMPTGAGEYSQQPQQASYPQQMYGENVPMMPQQMYMPQPAMPYGPYGWQQGWQGQPYGMNPYFSVPYREEEEGQ